MEEVYQDLCTVKHAANLARQEILEFVADNALGWLRLAFKKIHSNDLSREACKCHFILVLVFSGGVSNLLVCSIIVAVFVVCRGLLIRNCFLLGGTKISYAYGLPGRILLFSVSLNKEN